VRCFFCCVCFEVQNHVTKLAPKAWKSQTLTAVGHTSLWRMSPLGARESFRLNRCLKAKMQQQYMLYLASKAQGQLAEGKSPEEVDLQHTAAEVAQHPFPWLEEAHRHAQCTVGIDDTLTKLGYSEVLQRSWLPAHGFDADGGNDPKQGTRRHHLGRLRGRCDG
jgi:hypothetical protein